MNTVKIPKMRKPTKKQVQKLYQELGMTHAEIADYLEVTKSAVTKWVGVAESNARDIPLPAYQMLLLKAGKHPKYKLTEK